MLVSYGTLGLWLPGQLGNLGLRVGSDYVKHAGSRLVSLSAPGSIR